MYSNRSPHPSGGTRPTHRQASPTSNNENRHNRAQARRRGWALSVPRDPPQEAPGVDLQERIVRTAEHRLCLAERVNFAGPGLLPNIEVLHQPIALSMQRSDVLQGSGELLCGGSLRGLLLLELRSHIGLRSLFVSERLRVLSALLRRI